MSDARLHAGRAGLQAEEPRGRRHYDPHLTAEDAGVWRGWAHSIRPQHEEGVGTASGPRQSASRALVLNHEPLEALQ